MSKLKAGSRIQITLMDKKTVVRGIIQKNCSTCVKLWKEGTNELIKVKNSDMWFVTFA